MGDKRLSEIIVYEKHIAPYRLTEIVAGMGAGKNHWVENVLMEDMRVLLITSRKAKVNETKSRLKLHSCLNLSYLAKEDIFYRITLEKQHGSCVCNNWQIAYYMKEKYVPGDETTYLWNYFDIIVLDEAHSLATDATYTDVPFYVLDFLRAVYKFSDLPMVLMTATPTPIDGLFQLSNPQNFNLLDVRKECLCIMPEKIWHRTQQNALEYMLWGYNNLKAGRQKVVYFATKISTISSKIIPFLTSAGVPEGVIAVSYSSEESDAKFSEMILKNKERTEAYLSEHEDLPPDIMFFFTTSRNKEGINISNLNTYWDVYIESHWKEEAMQMWGRIREGRTQREDKNCSPINSVTLIDDAPQHESVTHKMDWSALLSAANQQTVNAVLDTWCFQNDVAREKCWHTKTGAAVIQSAHKMFPYLRYSIADHKFRIYRGRVKGEESFAKSTAAFENYINLYRGWGPEALVTDDPFPEIPSFFLIPHDRKEQFEDYAREKGFLNGTPMTEQDQTEMLSYISDVLHVRQKSDCSKKYAKLGKAVSEFGYELKECSKHADHPDYSKRRLVKKSFGEDFLDDI